MINLPELRMKPTLVLDIETGPADDELLLEMYPFTDSPWEGKPFRSTAKTQETIDRHRSEWEAEQRASRDAWESSLDHRRQQHLDGIREKAALSPVTGQVVAATGVIDGHVLESIHECEERVLDFCLDQMNYALSRGGRVITFNGASFDLPFLFARATVLGFDTGVGRMLSRPPRYEPDDMMTPGYHDMLRRWCGGEPKWSIANVSLLRLSILLGLPRPKQVMDGRQFAGRLDAGDVSSCCEYLFEEAQAHWRLAARLGY